MFPSALATLVGALVFLGLPDLSLAVEETDGRTYDVCMRVPQAVDLNIPWFEYPYIEDVKVYFTPENSNETREIDIDNTLDFSSRVGFDSVQRSLLLMIVDENTAGTYIVQLRSYNRSSLSSVTLRRIARVRVWEENPVGELNVTFGPTAARDKKGDWYVYLRCGPFSYDTPPFHVVWYPPRGNKIHRSDPWSTYENGSFVLRLPDHAQHGTYNCRIPEEAMPCRTPDQSSKTVSLTMNETEVRLKTLQAYQAALLKAVDPDETEQLTHQLGVLEAQTTELGDNLTAVTQLISQLKDELGQQKRTFEAEISRLRTDLTRPTNPVKNPEAQEHARRVSFSTRSNGLSIDDVSNLSRDVILNDGDAYDNNTGCFTAPFNGTYFFLADVESEPEDTLQFEMTLDDESVAQGTVKEAVVSRAVQALVRLSQGQQVCLRASSMDGRPWQPDGGSQFMGFLLYAD